jgi:hypothetical protein
VLPSPPPLPPPPIPLPLALDTPTGCWRDGILQGATGNATTDAAAGPLSLSLSQVVAACNYVPLWAGLTEGQEGLGPRVVQSLQASGLVQTSGGWRGGRLLCGCLRVGGCRVLRDRRDRGHAWAGGWLNPAALGASG